MSEISVTRLSGSVSSWMALGMVLLVGWDPSDASAQDKGLEVLNQAAVRYRDVETLCADFTQHLYVPLLGGEHTGTGRLCQAKPNLFAMRFDNPEGDLIVVDGMFTWVYFPSNDEKTVLKTSADRSAGGRDFHREFLENPGAKYEITYESAEDVEKWSTHRLRMVPKRSMSYRFATIWIDRGAPVLRRIQMEEANGNVRTITMENVIFDADPGSDFFMFTPPSGALVMVR